ncbi:TALPID3 protein-like isoform X2 [Dreissena polymorpha]|uniref:TALPID3 protein-like isoform X2 n=1 Tax=Dreissena polymorpha TaxID=45954 RepID=UPI0022654B4D|nr:TALPID3 protein-like isoform X2 [Dreissena polymorpha]
MSMEGGLPKSGDTSCDSRDSAGSGGKMSLLELLTITDAATKAINRSTHSASSHGSHNSQGSKKTSEDKVLGLSQNSDRSEKSAQSVMSNQSRASGASVRSHVSEVLVSSNQSAGLGVSQRSARSALSQHSNRSVGPGHDPDDKTLQETSQDSGVVSKTQTAQPSSLRNEVPGETSDVSTTASDILIRSTHERSMQVVEVVNEKTQGGTNGHYSSSGSSKCSKTSLGVDNFNSSGPQKVKISKKHLREIKSPYDEDSPRTSVSSDGKVPSALLKESLKEPLNGTQNGRRSADKGAVTSSNDSNGEKGIVIRKHFPVDTDEGEQFKVEKVRKSADKPYEDVNLAKSKSSSDSSKSKSEASKSDFDKKSQFIAASQHNQVGVSKATAAPMEPKGKGMSPPKYRVERHTPQKVQQKASDKTIIPEKKNLLQDLEDSVEIITSHAQDTSSGSSQPEIFTVPERIVTVSATNSASPSSTLSDGSLHALPPPVTFHSAGFKLRDDVGNSGDDKAKSLDDSNIIPPALSRNVLRGDEDNYSGKYNSDDIKPNPTTYNWFSRHATGRGLQQGGVVDGPDVPDKRKDEDVQISNFLANGQQKIAKEAFARRQGGPIRRVVQARIVGLDSKASSTSSTGELKAQQPALGQSNDQVLTAAAAASAAVAATQPFLRAQQEMELKMSEVLRKIEDITGGRSRTLDQSDGDRVRQLERQVAEMTERRIEYMERLQETQMALQAKFLTMTREPAAKPYQPRSYSPEANIHVGNRAFSKTTVNRPPAKVDNSHSRHSMLDHDDSLSPLDTPAPRAKAPRPTIYDTSDLEIRAARARSPYKGSSPTTALKTRSSPKQRSRSQDKERKDGGFLRQILASGTSPLQNVSPPRLQPTVHTRPLDAYESPNVRKAKHLIEDLNHIKNQVQGLVEDKENYAARHDIKEVAHDMSKASLGSQGPFPLDNYLQMPAQGPTTPYKSLPDLSFSHFNAPVHPGFKEAESILRQVQQNRGFLESNFEAVMRAQQEVEVYSMLEAVYNDSTDHEKARIKNMVDKSIQKLRREVEREVTDAVVISEIHKKASSNVPGAVKIPEPAPAPKAGPKYGIRGRLQQAQTEVKVEPKKSAPTKRVGAAGSGKESVHQRLSRPPVKKPKSVLTEDEMTRVYGKATYQKGRTTVKDPYLHFQNTSKHKPARQPPPPARDQGKELMSSKTQTSGGGVKQFYFNPATGMYIPIANTAHLAPIPGQLIPMAVPLGGPRMDHGLTEDATMTSMHPAMTFDQSKVSQVTADRNVAMVTLGMEDEVKRSKPSPELGKQVLPAVDIDTDQSEISESIEDEAMPALQPAISPERKPKKHVQIMSPHETHGKSPVKSGFEVVYHQDDTLQDEDDYDDDNDDNEDGTGLEYPGYKREEVEEVQYNGPVFPPKMPSSERQLTSDLIAEDIRRRDLLQNKANEWLEQELMARIITEVYPLREHDEPAEISHVVSETSEDSMAEEKEKSMFVMDAIGHRGMQLFIDTGVPVSNSVVNRLVSEVLYEKIRTMLGSRPDQGAGPEATPMVGVSDPAWESVSDVSAEQVSPRMARHVSTPEPTPRATPIPSPPGRGSSPAYTPLPSPPLGDSSPRVVERYELDSPRAVQPVIQQYVELESEPESSASYDIQDELNRLAAKLRPVVDPAASVQSRHDVDTPPQSPKPLPLEPSRPLTPPILTPREMSEEPFLMPQSAAAAGTSQERTSSRATKMDSPKSATSPQVTEMAEEELAEDQPKPIVFTVAMTQTDKLDNTRSKSGSPSPAKLQSPELSEDSYTESSSISDTFNECVSEGQWLINKSDGEMPDFPIDHALVRDRMLQHSRRKVDVSSASTWKDAEDVDLGEVSDISRSEGELRYKADFPPEKDPVLHLLSRLQAAGPQFHMYNMTQGQVTDVLNVTGRSEGEVIRVSALPREDNNPQIVPERDSSLDRGKQQLRSKSPRLSKSQRMRSPEGGAYGERDGSHQSSPRKGKSPDKRAPSLSYRAQSPTRVSFEGDLNDEQRSASPTRGILKRSSTFDDRQRQTQDQPGMSHMSRGRGQGAGRVMPGGRQTQGQGMMMAAARSPSPNKSQARRRMPLNRSSELQASGGSMENSGGYYGSDHGTRTMTPDQMNMDALIQSGYLSQSFSQSEGGRQTGQSERSSLRSSADMRGSRGQGSLGYSYGSEGSMTLSEIQRLATQGTGKLQMSLTLPTGQEESDLSEIDITDNGNTK